MKKNLKKLTAAFLIPGALVLTLAGCAGISGNSTQETTAETEAVTETSTVAEKESSSGSDTNTSTAGVPDGFSERDFDTSYADAIPVTLATGATSTDAEGVSVDGNTVTFTKAGSYILSGELEGGQIVIDLPGESDKIQIVLNGVNITNSSSAGIYVKNADKVFVTTASGSENSIATTGDFVQTDENNVDGAIYSKDDLVFNGEGTLKVSCAAGHGIVSKNDLKITGGTYEISSASKALQGKDMVGIAGGTLSLNAGTDGIDSVDVRIFDGDISITAGDEGINNDVSDENTNPTVTLAGGKVKIESTDDAIQSTGQVMISGADIDIVSGGGSTNAAEHYDDMMFGQMGGWQGMGQQGPQFGGEQSSTGEINYDTDDDTSANDGTKNKGIKAAGITVDSGNINIDSQDDAIHADGEILINGGTFTIKAGDDGIHADEKVIISGGTFNIDAWEGIEATVVQINDGDITINASDDGINSTQKVSGLSSELEINGGNLVINMAQGDTDALDSNGTIYITGGNVELNAQSPFDYDGGGSITGGTVYVNGTQVTELYNQMMGGGMQGGMQGSMQGGPGMRGGMQGGQV